MAWILYALGLYLAVSYGLMMYMVVKLLLGRSMRMLVGPQDLSVTKVPTRLFVLLRPTTSASRTTKWEEDQPQRKAA